MKHNNKRKWPRPIAWCTDNSPTTRNQFDGAGPKRQDSVVEQDRRNVMTPTRLDETCRRCVR